MSDQPPDAVARTRARLTRSRQSLLAALAGVTEADFRREVDGELLVERLAKLARRERAAVAAARQLLAGAGSSDDLSPEVAASGGSTTLPPQAIHALAGARHRSLRLLDEVGASEQAAAGERARDAALALLDETAEREQRVAALIGSAT